jgi:tetratricopeptide (TPR) repeat protein
VAVEGAPPASTSAPAVEAFNSGLAAMKAKDYATAAAKFEESVTHDPALRQAWEALSSAAFEAGRNDAAAAAADKAIALGSTQEAVYLARWKAYKNLGDAAKTAAALEDLEKIGRRTEEAKRIYNEAVGLTKAGDHANAFTKFQEALAVDPNLQTALLGLANAGVKIGRNAEAATAAETLLKADPQNEAAVRVLYNAALAQGEKTRLADALMRLAPYEPAVAKNGLLQLAFEAYDANDSRAAKERFGKVVQLDPSYPQAYYYLGVMYAAEGATKEAVQNLQRFLQLAPNDPEAKSAREMLDYLK